MNKSFGFLLIFFCVFIFSIFFLQKETTSPLILGSIALALSISILVNFFELVLKKSNFLKMNLIFLGTFVGYIFSKILNQVFYSFIQIGLVPPYFNINFIEVFLLLMGIYLGITLTLKNSQEFTLILPFIRFRNKSLMKKDILIDDSVLADPRILDLAVSGLLDQQLILPRFIIDELQEQIHSREESISVKAKNCLEVFKKLEEISSLNLRLIERSFTDPKEIQDKMIYLAKQQNANIMTADINKIENLGIKGTRVINIHSLSKALKPLMENGELLKIKIQRVGKEPLQGIGYLDDGTMIVVNGGGDYIGKTVPAIVLSVKHTHAGRMVFCNIHEKVNEYEAT